MAQSSDTNNSSAQPSLQQRFHIPCLIVGAITVLAIIIMPYLGEVGMGNPQTASILGLWVNFLGHFHPIFLHLPIGALMLVIVMEVCGLFSGGKYQPHTTLGLFFTSATAVFAVTSGYLLYLTGSFEGELIEEHKRDGILFTSIIITTFLIKYTADLKPEKFFYKPIYALCLIASGGAMIAAGHHGGEYTHGDPLDALPSKVLNKRITKDKGDLDANPVIYTQIIHPILEEKCISCHGPKKKKSGLRMDTYKYMLDGGDEDECLVPGDIEHSGLITTLHLPDNDDFRMPPLDEPQLSEDEIKVLTWWVAIGAPEKSKLSEVTPTEDIEQSIQSILSK